MNDDVFTRYGGPRSTGDNVIPLPTAEGTLDLVSFGFLRGTREMAVMLELRRRDGSLTALAYHLLHNAQYEAARGITLHFGGNLVRITGRNLNAEIRPNVRLYDAILRHRVPWIAETDGATGFAAAPGELVIERIEIDG